MNSKKWIVFIAVYLLNGIAIVADGNYEQERRRAHQLYEESNIKEAYNIFEKLVLAKNNNARKVGNDLQMAIVCLRRLGLFAQTDALYEKAVAIHRHNWQLLYTAAQGYSHRGYHYGFMVSGKFERGPKRGGQGKVVNAYERDRVRCMQLMHMALSLLKAEHDVAAVGSFYLKFADMLLKRRGHVQAWRLQSKTDLSRLPDYEDGYGYYYGGQVQGAAVDAQGNPIFHEVPESFSAAKTDGQRWRWLLTMASELDESLQQQVQRKYADFLYQQFGVQTMGSYSRYDMVDEQKRTTGLFALHTLQDNETIARLATGIKRFQLPAAHNHIKIYKRIAASDISIWQRLAEIYQNRRQYPQAAAMWRKYLQFSDVAWARKKLQQIIGNWGQFLTSQVHPHGSKAELHYRFRNATQVQFSARKIYTRRLLTAVKNYLQSNPHKLEYERMNLRNIGYMLVTRNQMQYVGAEVASWQQKLKPAKNHFDRRIVIETPLKKAGAYLLTAKVDNGNTSRIVVWISNTVIARKPLNDKIYYYVADAVTGAAVANLDVEFFGYRQEYVGNNWLKKMLGRRYDVYTKEFTVSSDENGAIVIPATRMLGQKHRLNWLVIAKNDTRFAFMGFKTIWASSYRQSSHYINKAYVISDRPLYRPAQVVKFKVWCSQMRYDGNDNAYAATEIRVYINNPKGEKVFERSYRADRYGGIDGEYPLPKGATLGQYRIYVNQGGGQLYFRVEEYKKPEFEVKIESPKEAVQLGDKVTATVKARYYFGAPVTNAKVKLKILRYTHRATWYPPAPWDWLYGSGYWWQAYDYSWYPGWQRWGCRRPFPRWGKSSPTPPEVIVERELNVGKDGSVPVEIDTLLAKEIHGDSDHRYEITAEVTDKSRRTIVGTGQVLVARQPYKVYTWLDRGYYRRGETIVANFCARTIGGTPVTGSGVLKLFKVNYDAQKQPQEQVLTTWNLPTNEQGQANARILAADPGQYRLSYTVTDAKQRQVEGGYVFVVRGPDLAGRDFHFNKLELVADKREYRVGEQVQLAINTDYNNSTVLLFVRPVSGVYERPQLIKLRGKSHLQPIVVAQNDMPNFFVEAITIYHGQIYTTVKEIVVPPQKRVLNVEIIPSSKKYQPGEWANFRLKITDTSGKPYSGSMVVSMYDKALEYISQGSNVGDIKSFFWKWRRHHHPVTYSTLNKYFPYILQPKQQPMQSIGIFGHSATDVTDSTIVSKEIGRQQAKMPTAPMERGNAVRKSKGFKSEAKKVAVGGNVAKRKLVQPTVRKNFADSVYWKADLDANIHGEAQIKMQMPENLTTWKMRAWAIGSGTRVGGCTAEVITSKNLLLRLQAPRFFVEKDEVVLSANVHNYLATAKNATVVLETNDNLQAMHNNLSLVVTISAGGEQRVNWRMKVVKEGRALVRMKALTDEESDAMQMYFPVKVHGIMKTVAFSGHVPQNQTSATIEFTIPKQRRLDETKLEVRYSPTLAGAMIDALPYLVSYPYGCTEQTLNRFLPTVLVQKILIDSGIDLQKALAGRTNLNPQEIGDDRKRKRGWQQQRKIVIGYDAKGNPIWGDNPVFSTSTVTNMVHEGVKRLADMQLSDGGWGWFSGWGEHSYPHTTAYVVHGLQLARQNDAPVPERVLELGIDWLRAYRKQQLLRLQNAATKTKPYKHYCDNLDAFVSMVLANANCADEKMLQFLYRDRAHLAIYGMCMYGIALHQKGYASKAAMIRRNIEQYLVKDVENQTAYLRLGNGRYWWYWYGSEWEAHAYYLKLLARIAPKEQTAAWLVKYLLNNRRHATYWNSTRDTAICIEAMAEYMRAVKEDKPNMDLEIYIDGRKCKQLHIDHNNLFSFDNKLLLTGAALTAGKHLLEFRKKGQGPLYFNAYVNYFSLQDYITRAGLEIKVDRKYYRLIRKDKKIEVAGDRGQVISQKVDKYRREPLQNLARIKSGDLVEVELTIVSKNDYEYLVFEDLKAAGFEVYQVRSGYIQQGMPAYMELRNDRVAFFVSRLPRGQHSIHYRLRAEIPGFFSALPTKAYAMYAPELKANSDEVKFYIDEN